MIDFLKKLFGFQKQQTKVHVQTGNAIVTEYRGSVGGIYGPGTVLLREGERIKVVFDLRPQFQVMEIENVVTADLIPLSLELGIGYQIEPLTDLSNYFGRVFKEKNYGLFPVSEDTLIKAAFNTGIGGWQGWAPYEVTKRIRKHIMTFSLIEIFALKGSEVANSKRIQQIETTVLEEVNFFGPDNVGIIVTAVDIRQIVLPDEVKPTEQSLSNNEASSEVSEPSLDQQIINLSRRLQKLREIQAIKGIDIEPHHLIEIEDIEAELKILTKLRGDKNTK